MYETESPPPSQFSQVFIKIYSPHWVDAFGDQNPPKMGVYDLDWMSIFFFIHLDAFKVEKVEESMHKTIFFQ